MTRVAIIWKAKWFEEQKVKFSKLLNLIFSKAKEKWLRAGLIWGLFMYISMTMLFPLIEGESLTQKKLLIGIPLWIIGGFGYGYMIKGFFPNEKLKNED